jgi:hypothetical protein
MAHTVLDKLRYFTCIAFPGFCIQQCSTQVSKMSAATVCRTADRCYVQYKPVTSCHNPVYFIILLPMHAYCVLLSNNLLRLRPASPAVKGTFEKQLATCFVLVFRPTLFTVVILLTISTQGDCYMWWRDKFAIKWPRLNYPQISLGLGLPSFLYMLYNHCHRATAHFQWNILLLTMFFQQGFLWTVSGYMMCNQRFANSQTDWIMLIYYPNNGLERGPNTTTALSQNFLSLN